MSKGIRILVAVLGTALFVFDFHDSQRKGGVGWQKRRVNPWRASVRWCMEAVSARGSRGAQRENGHTSPCEVDTRAGPPFTPAQDDARSRTAGSRRASPRRP